MPFSLAVSRLLPAAALSLLAALPLHADNARFDLVGPKVEIKVTRGSMTLPIAEVPNLQPGDRIWVKADLPDDQKNHLLLILAFLRGTTNEPPDSWFTEIDTWDRKHTAEGTTVTVPDDAQQALLFVAPETGGDFKTLRSAVKGRPGLFIRADADLNEASFEQGRIERYLAAMKTVPADDPRAIQDHSAKLATTLALKPNADCFKQPVEAQLNCLTQSSAPVLLSDGHGQTVAEALSTGPSSDFINAASATSAVGGGLYSAYVGAVIDLVHLVSTLHTARYQYIPGLSFPQGSTLNLRLNAPVSFIDPKSVIVIGLPAIQKAVLPPLRAHDPTEIACLLQPRMALQLEGAPLVFSTSFAHDLVLHLNRSSGAADLPLTPDAFEGGLIVSRNTDPRKPLQDPGSAPSTTPASAPGKSPEATDLLVTGTVHGFWGFDAFDGPTLQLQQIDGNHFRLAGDTQLLAGQDNHLTLIATGTACVQHIALIDSRNKDVAVAFRPAPADTPHADKGALALDVPLKQLETGGYALAIRQFGEKDPARVALIAYNGDIHLTALKIHQGDSTAVLTGQGLANVAEVSLAGQTFAPAETQSEDDELALKATAGASAKQSPAEASVKLKDGRTFPVRVITEAPRPSLALVSLSALASVAHGSLPIRLNGKDEIPLSSRLTFVIRSSSTFPRDQRVEVATDDDSVHTTLSLADNRLILQDPYTAIATLDPLQAFGTSAFGKLQMRPVAADGTTGAWTPLGTLVRTPQIDAIHCNGAGASTCSLSGKDLFLLAAVSPAPDFSRPAEVPSGFAESTLPVPAPQDGSTLYLKLRDDPGQLASVTLPQPVQPTISASAPAAATASPAATIPSNPSAPAVPASVPEPAAPTGSNPH